MLVDNFGRRFAYLRLSITDVCNFRCQYCLPHGYQKDCSSTDFLSLAEIRRLIRAFSALGMQKVRLTGGEASLRRDFLEIAAMIAAFPNISTLALSSNGFRLGQRLVAYQQAGINHLNISIDSLEPSSFHAITGHRGLPALLAAIDQALGMAFKAIKINTVLLRGLNSHALGQFAAWIKDRPLSLRFIELMQTADNQAFFAKHHVRGQSLREELMQQGWQELPRDPLAGPARVLSHPDYQGSFGFIEPYDRHFCTHCNRLRITARGQLQLCLFGNGGLSLRPLLQSDAQEDELQATIKALLTQKGAAHRLHEGNYGSTRNFASIGG